MMAIGPRPLLRSSPSCVRPIIDKYRLGHNNVSNITIATRSAGGRFSNCLEEHVAEDPAWLGRSVEIPNTRSKTGVSISPASIADSRTPWIIAVNVLVVNSPDNFTISLDRHMSDGVYSVSKWTRR